MDKELYTLAEAAELLDVRYRTLYRVVTLDMIDPPLKIGGRYLILSERLDEFRKLLQKRRKRRRRVAK